MELILYALAGALGGVLGGMGMGGGTLLIPILTLILKADQHAAQAINLISFIPMAIVALVLHAKKGYVDFKGAIWAIAPGVAFAAVYGYVAGGIEGAAIRRAFGVFLMLLSALQILFILLKSRKSA